MAPGTASMCDPVGVQGPRRKPKEEPRRKEAEGLGPNPGPDRLPHTCCSAAISLRVPAFETWAPSPSSSLSWAPLPSHPARRPQGFVRGCRDRAQLTAATWPPVTITAVGQSPEASGGPLTHRW